MWYKGMQYVVEGPQRAAKGIQHVSKWLQLLAHSRQQTSSTVLCAIAAARLTGDSKHPLTDVQRKRQLTCIGVTILCSSLYVEFLPGERSSFPCKPSWVHQGFAGNDKHTVFACGISNYSVGVFH